MPCRHIAAVCRNNESILGKNETGFPLASVKVFWWNQYYLYGMSRAPDHQKLKNALLELAEHDTEGWPCPLTLDEPLFYSCPDNVFDAFYRPASDRLANYECATCITALRLMEDRDNPRQMADCVPAGLSQVSHLPSPDEWDQSSAPDWNYEVEEQSDTEDYSHSRLVLSRHYNEVTEAINNSLEKEELEAEVKQFLNSMTVRARAIAWVPSSSQGQRVSMLPASSRKRKTHGTKHY